MANTWVVTGTNRGIGLEFVRQLAARGETVIATAREPGKASELNAVGVRVEALDIADAGSVAAFAQRMDGVAVDVLVNNAAIGTPGEGLEQLDLDELDRYFVVNSVAPLRVVRALLASLRAGSQRRIVHITSRMGSIAENDEGGYYGYRASKTALNSLNRTMAKELGEQGFVCAVLHPGWVQTDMGGPKAPLSASDSVAGLLEVIDGLSAENNGAFLDYTGASIAW